MPLLPLEPSVFPEDLLQRPAPGEEGPSLWWALHTRPRAEKALARKCLEGQLPFFLPLSRREWKDRERRRASHLPLFPGYVFLYGDAEARLAVLRTNLVAQVLPVRDQPRLWFDLARVYRLVTSGVPLAAAGDLPPGTPVEINRGPLAGLQGKVIRQGKRLKLLVEVQFLQQAVSAEIESWMVRPLNGCQAAPLLGAS
jgi:transcription antitermination factor NusG